MGEKLENNITHIAIQFYIFQTCDFVMDNSWFLWWKSNIKRDHDFDGKINIISVKSTAIKVTKGLISRNLLSVIHGGIYKNLLSHITVWKNEKFNLTKEIFRQINSLIVIHLVNCRCHFHEIFAKMREREIPTHTVDFPKFLYHNFLKNFRENNFFSKDFNM